jgi:hypothetical protein
MTQLGINSGALKMPPLLLDRWFSGRLSQSYHSVSKERVMVLRISALYELTS